MLGVWNRKSKCKYGCGHAWPNSWKPGRRGMIRRLIRSKRRFRIFAVKSADFRNDSMTLKNLPGGLIVLSVILTAFLRNFQVFRRKSISFQCGWKKQRICSFPQVLVLDELPSRLDLAISITSANGSSRKRGCHRPDTGVYSRIVISCGEYPGRYRSIEVNVYELCESLLFIPVDEFPKSFMKDDPETCGAAGLQKHYHQAMGVVR